MTMDMKMQQWREQRMKVRIKDFIYGTGREQKGQDRKWNILTQFRVQNKETAIQQCFRVFPNVNKCPTGCSLKVWLIVCFHDKAPNVLNPSGEFNRIIKPMYTKAYLKSYGSQLL